LVTFLFAAVIGRLIYIQAVTGFSLQVKALDQWTRDVPITGERGDIFDVNGVLLADTETLYTVYVRPVSVSNKEFTANTLGKILGVDTENLYTKMLSKKSEITVSKKVTKQEMNEISETAVTGVYFSQNLSRKYVYGDFLSQVLGFTNIDGMGQSGVEAYYNDYLKGIDGYILTETDLVGRELSTNVTQYIEGKKGASVYLTVDYAIQSIVESAITEAYARHNATNVSCLMMNAKTGAIVALAQRPSLDLNNLPRENVAELFAGTKSLLVSNVYEPGSTFKILTAAMGLEYGVVSKNTTVFCPGFRIVDGQRIKCWRTIGHGSQTFTKAVQNSCNCLFMDTAQKIGAKRFYDGLRKFGIMEKTGVDMSGEASSLTIPFADVKTVDLARMGFGQAIAVTPLEILTACAAVVNGGKLLTPYIVDRAVDNSGKTVMQNYPSVKSNVVSAETSRIMREILLSVVNEGGGKNARVSGYEIGGKTGTAQKYKNGAIASGMYVSSFVGFAPANDPEYIMLFIVDEPKGGPYYGSIVAAPYAAQIFERLFAYKGIKPTVPAFAPAKTFIMPNLIGMSFSSAAQILDGFGIFYETEGESGTIVSQYPAAGTTTSTNDVAYIEFK